jgi:hypothetical protein
MLRDSQPIHNIGFGVTSRDTGNMRGNEDVASSPNSGFIARALDGNPITKMATAMIATGIAATYAGKFAKTGGLKLGLKITQAAQRAEAAGTNSFLSRAHSGLLKVRGVLDELEGVSRDLEGKRSLVYRDDVRDLLSTGYHGISSYRDIGYDAVRRGSSSLSTWNWRNQLQQDLVRQARRLPYEVGGFYVADKTVGRAITGEREENKPRRKWYDPARVGDFGKDLLKTAAFQMGGFMLPTAMAGASAKSSLNFYRTAEQRMDSAFAGYKQITPVQKKIYEGTNFLRGSLQEVGTDLVSVLKKGILFSERSSGAISAAITQIKFSNPVADMYAARHGVPPNIPNPTHLDRIKYLAQAIYRGTNAPAGQQRQISNLLDYIPGYKSIKEGADVARRSYLSDKAGQIFLSNPSQLNRAQDLIIKAHRLGANATDEQINPLLTRAIDDLNRKRTSPLIQIAQQFEEQVGVAIRGRSPVGGLRNKRTSSSASFRKILFDSEYKKRVARELETQYGVDKKTARYFADSMEFDEAPFKPVKRSDGTEELLYVVPEERINIGGAKPESNFFETIIQRYNEGAIGKSNNINITGDQLSESIRKVDFGSTGSGGYHFEFGQKGNYYRLYGIHTIAKTVDRIGESFEKNASVSVLRNRKLQESDVDALIASVKSGARSTLSGEYQSTRAQLIRTVARVMGYTDDIVAKKNLNLELLLTNNGINPNDLNAMSSYLLANKAMIHSQFGSFAQFMGAKGLLLGDPGGKSTTANTFLGREQALFENLYAAGLVREPGVAGGVSTRNLAFIGNEKVPTNPIRQIIAGIGETAATAGNISEVRGYYQVGDQVINFNPIFSGIRKATEVVSKEVQIPIIQINPLQMLGIKDFSAMSKAGRFQVTSARGPHPFIPKDVGGDGFVPDMYTWHSTGGLFGTKGKITAHKFEKVNKGRMLSGESVNIRGTYRPIAVTAGGMIARSAELAATETTARTTTASTLSGKIKEKLDFDPEQQNSLFKFFGRLIDRQSDVNNPAVMANIIKGKVDEPFSIGGFGRSRSVVLREVKDTADDSIVGYELRNAADDSLVASHSQLMESFTEFANNLLSYGYNSKVSEKLLTNPRITGDLKGIFEQFQSGSPSSEALRTVLNPKTSSELSSTIRELTGDLARLRSKIRKWTRRPFVRTV